MSSDTECGTECSKMCFQKMVVVNMYFVGDFDAVVGTSSATFLEECTNSSAQAGHDITCSGVRDDQGSIKVVISGPEVNVLCHVLCCPHTSVLTAPCTHTTTTYTCAYTVRLARA